MALRTVVVHVVMREVAVVSQPVLLIDVGELDSDIQLFAAACDLCHPLKRTRLHYVSLSRVLMKLCLW